MKSYLSVLVISALLLTGCSPSQEVAPEEDAEESIAWNSSLLLNQAIDLSMIKKWGYFGGDNTTTIEVDDFKDPSRNTSKDLVATKPVECEPIGALFAGSPKSGADLLLTQNQSNAYLLPSKTLLYNLHAYSSTSKSLLMFEKIKAVADMCGSFLQMRSSKANTSDNWDSVEIGSDNVIRATHRDLPVAYAIGQIQSTIFFLVIIEEKLSSAKDKIEEAITFVSTSLAAKQS
jgi:hypothetical protein